MWGPSATPWAGPHTSSPVRLFFSRVTTLRVPQPLRPASGHGHGASRCGGTSVGSSDHSLVREGVPSARQRWAPGQASGWAAQEGPRLRRRPLSDYGPAERQRHAEFQGSFLIISSEKWLREPSVSPQCLSGNFSSTPPSKTPFAPLDLLYGAVFEAVDPTSLGSIYWAPAVCAVSRGGRCLSRGLTS